MTVSESATRDRALEQNLWRTHIVGWAHSPGLTPYDAALAAMEQRVGQIRAIGADELVWLVEHPPLYTAGTSAKPDDLREPDRFPVFISSRGGQFTYHGPGQRVVYAMLDLDKRGRDVRAFVYGLEEWMIQTLKHFDVRGERKPGRIGVWVDRTDADSPTREDKIGAIGVRIRRGVSFHGLALNVEPELSHFSGITPCGVDDPLYGVTSLADLGVSTTMADVDLALRAAFETIFGPTEETILETPQKA